MTTIILTREGNKIYACSDSKQTKMDLSTNKTIAVKYLTEPKFIRFDESFIGHAGCVDFTSLIEDIITKVVQRVPATIADVQNIIQLTKELLKEVNEECTKRNYSLSHPNDVAQIGIINTKNSVYFLLCTNEKGEIMDEYTYIWVEESTKKDTFTTFGSGYEYAAAAYEASYYECGLSMERSIQNAMEFAKTHDIHTGGQTFIGKLN